MPPCIWRMKKIQKPISSTKGAAETSAPSQAGLSEGCTLTSTFLVSSESTTLS